MITVMLVDDHPLVRAGLRALLGGVDDVEVVAEAEDGERAVAGITAADPDIVIMDLSMPGGDGVTATRRILAVRPQTRIVVLTSFADDARVREAIAAGAVGYLLKDCAPGALLEAIRAAAVGHAPLDARVTRVLLPGAAAASGPQLSARETEVLRLASRGMANKQIARSLGIAEHTVKIHLGSVYRRLGVADRTSAALWARDHLAD